MKMPWRRETARETAPAPSPQPEPASLELLTWASALDTTSLSEETVSTAERFLQEYRRMNLRRRRDLALELRYAIAAQVRPVPPPSVGSMDIIATAISARRRQLG